MKLVLAIIAVILAVLAAPLLFKPAAVPGKTQQEGLPWQIETTPEGTRVFGLTLGKSTLADARTRFGEELQVAVVAAPGETGTLEAYAANASLGGVTGKLILATDVPAASIQAMRDHAVKSEYMESTTRKFLLRADDLQQALRTPIRAITLIPSANLDEATVRLRFGAPAERIRGGETLEHLLYPAKGLAVALDASGKDVLQYVAPSDFSRLRDPLLGATAHDPAH